MRAKLLGLGLLAILAQTACSKDSSSNGNGGTVASCKADRECRAGFVCGPARTCVEDQGCQPGSCSAGKFCDERRECVTVAQKCADAPGGCQCFFLNTAGQLDASGSPQIRVAPGATRHLGITMLTGDGVIVPGATFTLSLEDEQSSATSPSTFFDLDANAGTISATSTPGSATLRATAGNEAQCTARVYSLGALTADHAVRFMVIDEITGLPITDAQLVVDTNGDGTGEGSVTNSQNVAGTTGTDGVAVWHHDANFAGSYTVTVFRSGYNYMSLVGLDLASGHEIALPLSPSDDPAKVGGFSGKLSFRDLEQLVLGQAKQAKLGIVASSFPLRSVLNFDYKTFVGPIGSCAPGQRKGCYALNLLGQSFEVPLPGGIVGSFDGADIKSSFDVVGIPGRRIAWGLGTELALTDNTALISKIMPLFSKCDCDLDPNVCDPQTGSLDNLCKCDKKCGLELDFQGLLDGVVPLLSDFAVGTQGNIPLPTTDLTQWDTYTATAYGARAPNTNYARLDDAIGAEAGHRHFASMQLSQGMKVFTHAAVPTLPVDTMAGDGSRMEGMLVLTGVEARGFGFVPMGLGIGTDCTTRGCLRRDKHPGDFDGVVNGVRTCTKDPCPYYGVAQRTSTGHVGVFHAQALGGLAGQPWVTIVAALPINALFSDDKAKSVLRGKGYLIRSELNQGDSAQLQSGTYPEFPARPTNVAGRRYVIGSTSNSEIHWVTLTSAVPNGSSAKGARWNVFFEKGATSFAAPAVPSTGGTPWVDPFQPAGANASVAEGEVSVVHLSFRTAQSSTSLSSLASNDDTNLGDLLNYVDGFAVVGGNIRGTLPTP